MKSRWMLGSMAALPAMGALLDCSQTASQVTFRSLERSSKVAFLCIADPYGNPPGRPLDYCRTAPSPLPGVLDYSVPHTIALVTQTARGEVAVVDTTAGTVLDQDPSSPGFNFIPVGQSPADIATTAASSATFVAIADPIRPGIWGLPTSQVLPSTSGAVPGLTSFPVCALPSRPSSMVVLNDPLAVPGDPSSRRAHCPTGRYAGVPAASTAHSLDAEAQSVGTPKLVVALPDLGELVVIDAQDVLANPLGTFNPCPIELVVPLRASEAGTQSAAQGPNPGRADGGATELADGAATPGAEAGLGVPGEAGSIAGEAGEFADGGPLAEADVEGGTVPEAGLSQDSGTDGGEQTGPGSDGGEQTGPGSDAAAGGTLNGGVCYAPAKPSGLVRAGVPAHPSGMAYSNDGRLFVADDQAPIIHVLNAASPCSMIESEPLFPTSATEPSRDVVTNAIAVSPLTRDSKRFVYAVDLMDEGSLMVFDVSEGSTQKTPLRLADPAYAPYGKPDRVVFGAPVQSITFARHDVPIPTPNDPAHPTGEIVGELCDPTNLEGYYTPAIVNGNTSSGASPTQLRGLFGFVALSNGRLSIVDIDDFDAPCRRPKQSDAAQLGCSGGPARFYPAASNEVSCKVVERNRIRSTRTFLDSSSGNRSPTMQSLPTLQNRNGTGLPVDPSLIGGTTRPRLLGPVFDGQPAELKSYVTQVASGASNLTLSPYPYGASAASVNWVAFDLREPRIHRDQTWTVSYEGQIPGTGGHLGVLQCADPARGPAVPTDVDRCEEGPTPSGYIVQDPSAAFCGLGVQDADMARRAGVGTGDIYEIVDSVPASDDAYWATAGSRCSYDRCLAAYGTPQDPNRNGNPRERLITAAYQDRLEVSLKPNQSTAADSLGPLPLTCCFPYPPKYTIRGGQQWIVFGSVAGFLHHVAGDPSSEDPATARCVTLDPACDPTLRLRNGRLRTLAPEDPVPNYNADNDPRLFKNPYLRFSVWGPLSDAGTAPSRRCADCIQRDMTFVFQEVGGFEDWSSTLSSTSLVLPQSIQFVPGIRRVAIPDGNATGLLMFNLDKLIVSESYM